MLTTDFIQYPDGITVSMGNFYIFSCCGTLTSSQSQASTDTRSLLFLASRTGEGIGRTKARKLTDQDKDNLIGE